MRVTQQDVAKAAKVSQATVSRVLAGDPRVEPSKRDRVVAAMQAANYQPDVRAQALRSKRTRLFGLVLKRPQGELRDDPFFASLLAEITQYLAKTPYHICLDVAESAEEQSAIYDELLRTRRVDGLILVEPEAEDLRLRKLQEEGFPFVVIGNPRSASMNSVDNDNVLAGRMATLHLIENGFRSIGMVGGPLGVAVSDDRVTGYRLAMAERNLPQRVWHSEFGNRAAAYAAGELLAEPNRPDALVVMDDFMALGVSRVAHSLQIAIPEDLALVAFSVSNLCSLIESGLTTVDMNIEQLVSQACRKLIDIVEGRSVEPGRSVVPCELRGRISSRPSVGVM